MFVMGVTVAVCVTDGPGSLLVPRFDRYLLLLPGFLLWLSVLGEKLDEVSELEKLEDAVRRGGLGPMGGLWAQAAAENRVHEAEVLDPERIEIPAGTPALLTREEADDVLEVLDLVAATARAGAGRDRCEELALLLRQRLRQAGL